MNIRDPQGHAAPHTGYAINRRFSNSTCCSIIGLSQIQHMTRRHHRHQLPGLVILIAGLLCSIYTVLAADDRSPLVVVSTAQTDIVIRQVPLSGTITSTRKAQLSTEVSGQVEKVVVEVGDRVEAGAALLELDREIDQLTLEALVAASRQAHAELLDAKRRLQDGKRLRKQNSISENDFRLLEAEVEIDGARLQQRLAEERRQQARVDRHTLRAPFSGAIAERLAETGEWIEPGEPVLTLIAVDDLRIEFRVPQEFYSRISPNTRISVTLDVFPEREFDGRIESIVPVSDAISRTFLIHARIDAGEARLTPGMSVHGRLHLSTGREGVVVSRDAILRYPDGRVTVWVIDPGSDPPTVSERRVTTGYSFDGLITIREGVQAGDVVIVRGNESLQEGQQVRIQRRE